MERGDFARFPEQRCPECGKKLDTARLVEKRKEARAPEAGDRSICLNCGHIMVFNEDFTLREMTIAEVIECAGDPSVIEATNLSGKFRQWKKDKGEL